MKYLTVVCSILVCCFSISANAVIIDFDDLSDLSFVDDFYSAEGVFFEPGAWTVTAFTHASAPNAAASLGYSSYMNIVGGFIGALRINASAFSIAQVNIFSGLNGTGALLASGLVTDDSLSLMSVEIDFAGIARSVTRTGGGGVFVWDNVTYTDHSVPLPATNGFVALGILALIARRRNYRFNPRTQ